MTRRVRWTASALLVVCFFLPFTRGCSHEPVAPREVAFSSTFGESFLSWGMPWLYPLALLAFSYGLRLVRPEAILSLVARMIHLLTFSLLTWLILSLVMWVYRETNQTLQRGLSLLAAAFVIVWGIVGLEGQRRQSRRLLQLSAFQVSAMSWIWIGGLVASSADRLIGAWLSLLAGTVIVATYLVDDLQARRAVAPTG